MPTFAKKCLFLGLIVSSLSCLAQTNDFGSWYGLTLEKKIVKDLRIEATLETRLNNNSSTFRRNLCEVNLSYRALKFLRISGGYRYGIQDSKSADVQRLFADLVGSKKIYKRTTLRSRLKYQYDFANNEGFAYGNHRVRPRIGIKHRIKKTEWTISHGHEGFYSIFPERSYWSRYRTYLGAGHEFPNKSSIGIKAIYQTDLNDSDIERDFILSVGYSIKL